MNKKVLSIILPLAGFIAYLSFTSFSSGISGSSTSGCSCHNPGLNTGTVITLSGLPTAGYVNGVTYTLTLQATNPLVTGPQPRAGFDLSASDGAFTAGTDMSLNGPTEILHSSPRLMTAGTASWVFTWTAPVSGTTPVTFEAACNLTNGDGMAGPGDEWNLFTTSVANAATPSATLNLTMFIQGYYIGSSTMQPVLANEGVSTNTSITDMVEVMLVEPTTYTVVASQNATLNTNGSATCNFPVTGNFYIAIKHRNGLQTWSANPVSLSVGSNTYNFTTAANKAYGDNMIEVETGVWAFYSGDVESDDNLDLLDISLVEMDISSFQFGYFATDINGDGNVDLLDTPALENNITNFVFSQHP